MNLNVLPDEVLCSIFDHLDLYELKLASAVCRRWSELTFSGRRMDRVLLDVRHTNCDFLFNTKRKYRNVRLRFFYDHLESALPLLLTLMFHVRILDLQCDFTAEQFRLILLEAPELQQLAICSFNIIDETREPSPVLPKFKSLEFNGSMNNLLDFLPRNMPNLQSLKMHDTTDFKLDALKTLSGQLKLVHVKFSDKNYLSSFLELTFPILEDFALNVLSLYFYGTVEENDFFRRHPFLRRLCIFGETIPVEWVESISQHCQQLTHLELDLENPNEGFLGPLEQLCNLNHLSLKGKVEKKVLRGSMKSLESVALTMNPTGRVLENLFEVAPQLSCLHVADLILCDDLNYICEKFSFLRRLELFFDVELLDETVADDFVRFDKLMHLQELKLSSMINIRSIHRNNVRCLTLHSYSITDTTDITDDDLHEIPEKFPLLNRLILEGYSVPVDVLERLHKLMPSCRIDYGKKRFYPIDNVRAD